MQVILTQTSGVALINGELSFTTVPELNHRGCEFIKQSPNPVFNFAQVTFSDNTGVALLLSWVRCAKRMNKKISLTNLPAQLLDLITVSGLKEILPIK